MPILLFLAGALIAFAGTVLAVGAREPVGHVASRSRRIAAPPERVWELIAEDKLPGSWQQMKFELLESDRPRRLERKIVGESAFGGTWTWVLVPEGHGTNVTITERGEIYNPVFRFMSRYLLGFTRTMDQYLDALEAAVRS